MDKLRIVPVKVGSVTIDKSALTYMRNFGTPLSVPCIIWYVEGGGKRIIVDTGPPEPDWANEFHLPLVREKYEEPAVALEDKGIKPEEVDFVILSHLHWDHAYNNHLFVNAKFIIQRRELQYAIAPLPIHMKSYESVGIGMRPNYITNTKYTIIDGDKEIVPGVSAILTPGHTPGSMCVIVSAKECQYTIASDTVPLFENWQNFDPHVPHLPGAIHVGLGEYFESLCKIESFSDFVLPGHDIKVFDQEEYA